MKPSHKEEELRVRIGAKLRELRLGRAFTQSEFAAHLGISQASLSKIERGVRSLTAEQLIEVLRFFNVGVSEFVPEPSVSKSLMAALSRFGAFHLLAPDDVVLRAEHTSPSSVVLSVLVNPSSGRFVTALAAVLVWSIDQIPLPALLLSLENVGAPGRLPWLMENVVKALDVCPRSADRVWRLRRKRAHWVLTDTLSRLTPRVGLPDPFEPGIRTMKTHQAVWSRASVVSRRWGIISALKEEDFADALGRASADR